MLIRPLPGAPVPRSRPYPPPYVLGMEAAVILDEVGRGVSDRLKLPGVKECAQLEMAMITFMPARRSTKLPGAPPPFQWKRPSSSLAILAKKVIEGGTSER